MLHLKFVGCNSTYTHPYLGSGLFPKTNHSADKLPPVNHTYTACLDTLKHACLYIHIVLRWQTIYIYIYTHTRPWSTVCVPRSTFKLTKRNYKMTQCDFVYGMMSPQGLERRTNWIWEGFGIFHPTRFGHTTNKILKHQKGFITWVWDKKF